MQKNKALEKKYLIVNVITPILLFSCSFKKSDLNALLVNNKHEATIIIEQKITKNKRYKKSYFYEPNSQLVLKSFIIETNDTIKNVSSDFRNYIHFLEEKKVVTDNMNIILNYDSLSQTYVNAYINNNLVELIFAKKYDGLEFINIQNDSCKYELHVGDETNGDSSIYYPKIDTLQTKCYR